MKTAATAAAVEATCAAPMKTTTAMSSAALRKRGIGR
jgi:hypothetical protein